MIRSGMKCKLTFAMVFQVGKALAERCVSGSKRKSWVSIGHSNFLKVRISSGHRKISLHHHSRSVLADALRDQRALICHGIALPCPALCGHARTVHKTCTFWNNSLRNYYMKQLIKTCMKNWLSIL